LVESDANKFVLQRQLDFANIVANQKELDIVSTRLQQIFESLLGVFGHVVDLIQDNKFEPSFKEIFGLYKLVNLVANNIDSSLIRGIQVDYETLVFFYFLILVD
jgi:hypothetical protein